MCAKLLDSSELARTPTFTWRTQQRNRALTAGCLREENKRVSSPTEGPRGRDKVRQARGREKTHRLWDGGIRRSSRAALGQARESREPGLHADGPHLGR